MSFSACYCTLWTIQEGARLREQQLRGNETTTTTPATTTSNKTTTKNNTNKILFFLLKILNLNYYLFFI